jgi:hypothetical protein
MAGLPLVQMPPPVASVKVPVAAVQACSGPLMVEGAVLTVTVTAVVQPVPSA